MIGQSRAEGGRREGWEGSRSCWLLAAGRWLPTKVNLACVVLVETHRDPQPFLLLRTQ